MYHMINIAAILILLWEHSRQSFPRQQVVYRTYKLSVLVCSCFLKLFNFCFSVNNIVNYIHIYLCNITTNQEPNEAEFRFLEQSFILQTTVYQTPRKMIFGKPEKRYCMNPISN